jgi:hypothetical protein
MYLRGMDGFGAAAALYAASATGFKVSGVFRDAADFAVLVLYDADCFFEHPRFKYLPDFNLAGMVLTFDLTYSNLQPIDSQKYPTIDWPYLDVTRADGSTAQIPLIAHATQVSGTYSHANANITISASSVVEYDRVTLWYQNVAFDFIAAGGESASTIAANLAGQINAYNWTGYTTGLSAAHTGPIITVTASVAGVDGNMVTLLGISKNAHISVNGSWYATAQLASGSSSATWAVSIDFTALLVDATHPQGDQVRQMWLTFAPQLANGAAYVPANWDAVFTNWAVSDPLGNRPLKVAGPGSVRIDDTDSWCGYSGAWSTAAGFYSRNFAHQTTEAFSLVTIKYTCASAHNLYLGTALYTDRGIADIQVDGGAEILIDTYCNASAEIPARRLIQAGVAAGEHTVTVTLAGQNPASSGNKLIFDFLEAAVLSDIPDPPTLPAIAPAIDYDTQHGYQLPPARLMHIFDRLGCSGPIDEYVGVFWWNQRTNPTAVFPSVQATFGGTFSAGPGLGNGDQIFLDVGGTTITKSVFPADNNGIIAEHFACYINEVFSGVWAAAAGDVLTITSRSPLYGFTFSIPTPTLVTGSTGTVTYTGSLSGGVAGSWVIDQTQTPVLNYAAECWHADLFAQVYLRGGKITSALSMELVNPPTGWGAQFPDGSVVATSTGFNSLYSTQCPPMQSNLLAYQQAAYLQLAQLQAAAGLAPQLQFGEFLWWYSAATSGMAYYDAQTTAAATAALGRALHTFLTPNDDPSVNAYADALFLRNRLRDHCQAIRTYVQGLVAGAKFEILYPADVNWPTPVGRYNVGGQLNHFVNTPAEWQSSTSGYLDLIKVEALDFGSGTRSIDLAAQAIALAPGWGWPLAKIAYLYPVDNGGCPYLYEQQLAEGAGITALVPWALDHVCLFGWDLTAKLAPSADVA